MKIAPWILATAALMTSLVPAPAPAATGDPVMLIYRASGYTDQGGAANTGIGTATHCTNHSAVSENLAIFVRQWTGVLVVNTLFTLPPLRTWTTVSHLMNSFVADTNLATGPIDQGEVAIGSTTTSMDCSVMLMDAGSPGHGVSLHLVRYNPDIANGPPEE
jgi:hypothetical protein